MSKIKVIMPLPNYGFDPTEAAIPFKLMQGCNIEVQFATPNGQKANADELMLTGKHLGIFKPLLQARQDAVEAYSDMEKTAAFQHPLPYSALNEADFDAILLAGGHDKGVKEYLESPILQELIVRFFKANKLVGAICHGVVLVARSIDPDTQKTVIADYKTTALLKSQELAAYNLTRLWLNDYYLTYPETTVEDEVKSQLSDPNNFFKGSTPMFRDDMQHLSRGFVVQDRNYISARWPGDAYSFALKFIEICEAKNI